MLRFFTYACVVFLSSGVNFCFNDLFYPNAGTNVATSKQIFEKEGNHLINGLLNCDASPMIIICTHSK